MQAVNDETNGTIKKNNPQLSAAVCVCAGVKPCVLLANSTVCSIDLTNSEFACVIRNKTSDKVCNVRKSRSKTTLAINVSVVSFCN